MISFLKSLKRSFITIYRQYIHNCDTSQYDKRVIQLGCPLSVDPRLIQLDDYTRIQDDVKIISHNLPVKIKKYTAIASGCLIIPGTHIPTVGIPQFLSIAHINDSGTGITINEDCWIGAECVLLNKCEIGRGAVVGARSVVTKPIPPYAVVAGSPAKIIAVKFTIGQVLEHEKIIYPPNERMSERELKELYDKYYTGLRSIGTSDISDIDIVKLNNSRKEFGIKDYSKL